MSALALMRRCVRLGAATVAVCLLPVRLLELNGSREHHRVPFSSLSST